MGRRKKSYQPISTRRKVSSENFTRNFVKVSCENEVSLEDEIYSIKTFQGFVSWFFIKSEDDFLTVFRRKNKANETSEPENYQISCNFITYEIPSKFEMKLYEISRWISITALHLILKMAAGGEEAADWPYTGMVTKKSVVERERENNVFFSFQNFNLLVTNHELTT